MDKKLSTFDIGILRDWDATEIASKIKSKEISTQEVLECVMERAQKSNPTSKAIVAENYEPKEIPTEGIFAGVPMYIKDLVNVKGFPTRHGCEGMPDNIWKKSDEVIDQISVLGMPIIGKSATSEFGLLPSCETLINGYTRNPHHLDYSCGGSSGGAGALVASGVVPIAHTMDGGGSTRIPASCCGLIGLKPSRSRHVGSSSKGLPIDIVCHGIVSRTVRDTANYYYGIEQYKKHPRLPEIGLVENPIKQRLKIGMMIDTPVGIDSHDDVKNTILKAGEFCENLGHEVELMKNPHNDKVLLDFLTYYSMLARGIMIGGKFTFNKGFKKKKTELFSKELSSYFSKFIFLAPGAIRRLKKQVVNEYNAQFDKYDVVLSPVLNEPVHKLGYFGTDVSIISMIMKLNNYTGYTVIQNTTGAPALSLPMGFCKNGLPIGAMFGGKIGNERTLLELAFEIEGAGGLELMTKA